MYTSVRLTNNAPVAGFNHAAITHRKGVRIRGLWHGNIINEVVQQKEFDGYYDNARQLLVMRAEKEVALSAAQDLSDDDETSELFDLQTITIDFVLVMPVALNVSGAWFAGMRYPNIRSEAAFGDQINRDPEFARLSRLGQHSSVMVTIDFNGTPIKSYISRVGSVYFMEDYPDEMCLNFMVRVLDFRVVPPQDGRD